MGGKAGFRKKTDHLVVRVRFFVVVLALLILAWSLAFMAVERRNFVDAIYYTFVTITTVGYGDIHPESTAGKLMAILIILTGTGMFGGLVASMTEMLLNRRERRVRREKLHMVIGAFFSEVGTTLLVYFSDRDSSVERIKSDLLVSGDPRLPRFWPPRFARCPAGLRPVLDPRRRCPRAGARRGQRLAGRAFFRRAARSPPVGRVHVLRSHFPALHLHLRRLASVFSHPAN